VSDQLHASAVFLPGKDPRHPFDRRLGGPESRSGRGEEIDFQPPPGIKTPNPDRTARSPSLYRLSYSGSFIFVCYRSKVKYKPHLHETHIIIYRFS